MSEDTLKSFFVSVAARVDQGSFAKFNDAIGRTTKSAVALGAAVEAAFLSVNVWAAKVSVGFDQLYYSSQRIGASAGNIKALTYGLSQMGSTAGAASASMESFARTLRNNRGYYSVLERLGIGTKNADSTRRQATELMQEFGKALRSRSPELQHAYLEMFGIDELTGKALISGVDKFAEEYRQRLRKAGLDPDKAARDGNALQTTFRQIGSSIEIIGAKVASKLFEGQNNGLQRFLDFLDQNGSKIADVIALLAKVALELAMALLKLATSEGVTKALNAMLGAFGNLDEKTGAFTADLGKLQVALGVFATFVASSWVMKVLGAFGLLGKGWGSLLRTLGLPAAIGMAASGGGHMNPQEYKDALASDPARAKADAELNARGGAGKRYLGDVLNPKPGDTRTLWERAAPKALGGKDAPAAPATPGPTSAEEVGGTGGGATGALESYNFWRSKGLSHTAAAGLVAMEEGESNTFNPRARGDGGRAHGTFQHHPDRRAAIKRALGIDISNGTHLDQLRAAHWEFEGGDSKAAGVWQQIKDAESAYQAAALGTRYFERPEDKIGESRKRGIRGEYWARKFQGLPVPSDRPAPKLTADDILPGGLSGSTNGGLPSFRAPSPTPPAINQRTSSVIIHQGPISVQGMNDGKQIADRIDRVQGYRTSDLARNMRSSVG